MPDGQLDQAVGKHDRIDPLHVDVTGEVHMRLLSAHSVRLGFVQSDSGTVEKLRI
jgi:hypothetical protein